MKSGQQKRALVIVTLVVAVIVAARLASFGFFHRTGTVDPRVRLPEMQLQEIAQKQRQQQVGAFNAIVEGEVSRTEERIREATALATAASLFAANETLNGRMPATVGALLARVSSAGLLPPGIQLSGTQGYAFSSHAKLLVRYRPEPLGVEVVSLGRVQLDGPALLVRVPDTGLTRTNQADAGLYVASSLTQVSLPKPFALQAELLAFGFAPEPLRAANLPRL